MKMTTTSFITALTLLGGLSVAPDSASAYYSLLGGETLKVRDSAIEVQVGYPDLRLGYHIPIIKNLEVIPRLGLFYNGLGKYAGTTAPFGSANFGMRLGVDVKWRFFSKNKVHLAYVGPLGLHMRFSDTFLGAIQIPLIGGVAVTWEATKTLNVVGGLNMPFAFLFAENLPSTFIAPFIFSGGVEFALNDQLSLSAMLEMGPILTKVEGLTATTSAYVSALVGAQYRL
jgi:hypothetical protein